MSSEFGSREEGRASAVELRDGAAGQSEGPLSTLEALRRDAVDVRARSLRDARAVLEERLVALSAARVDQLDCEQRLARERTSFAAARSVRALQALSGTLRALEGELGKRSERVRRLANAEREARAELAQCTQALLAAERDRRAASSVLEGQRLAQLRVSERREEEEAEEAFRARRQE